MCCIIHRLVGSREISKEDLEKIIKKNSDGWGLSYLDDQRNLIVEKDMDMSLSIERIRILEKDNREFLFHARWATHGGTNIENCHPFTIPNGLMFHNGKLELPVWDKGMSDSWHFTKKLTKPLRRGKKLNDLIETKFKDVVKDCRFAFMMKDGTVQKFGTWHEIDGSFYSKLDWKYPSSNRAASYWDWNKTDDLEEKTYQRQYNAKTRLVSVTPYKAKSIVTQVNLNYNELIEIEDRIKDGNVRDEDIDAMKVDDIATLCEQHPAIMGNYVFNLIRKGI